jgi:N-methylhydantoinase B
VQGGRDATPGRFTLLCAATGTRKSVAKEKGLALEPGDMLSVETAGGGGYGPPGGRALAAIQHDLDAGYISTEAAERDYGIEIGGDGRACRPERKSEVKSGEQR